MTTAETNTFGAALEEKRRELIRTIRGKAAGLVLENGEADLLDQIQGMAGRDEIAIMLNRLSATLGDVQRAFQAISDGSYGICAMCDEPISTKRLQVIPWAAHCVRCQEEFEARNKTLDHSAAVERQSAYKR